MKMQRVLIAGLLIATACCGSARAQGMPDHVQQALNRFVGKWHVEDVVDGKTTTADFEAEWTTDKSALTYRWSGRGVVNQLPTTATGTVGWDGKDKIVRERNFSADGSTFEATHAIEPGAKEWSSPAKGAMAQGDGFVNVASTRVITWKNDDLWVVNNKDRKIDGKDAPVIVTTCRRAKSEAARHLDFWKPMLGNWKTRSQAAGKETLGTAHWELSPTKSCLVSRGLADGQPAGHGVEAYDPVLRAWKSVGFNTAGDSTTLVVHVANMAELKQLQSGAKGTYEIYVSLANGTLTTDTGNWVFPSWDDKQHVLQLTNVMKNGQPQPDVTIHYERQ